jgi:hypothetical protein
VPIHARPAPPPARPGPKNMKLWQKVAVAPLVAMAFLLVVAVLSYVVLGMQSRTLEQMYKERFSAYQTAAGAAQDISEVHSNVYRLFTWIQNLKPEQIDKATAEQKKKIAEVAAEMEAFGKLDLADDERKLVRERGQRDRPEHGRREHRRDEDAERRHRLPGTAEGPHRAGG